MIVEHAFISTRDGAEVQASARDLLLTLGFSPTVTSAPPTADCLDLSRGRRHARQAVYHLDRQPQRVRPKLGWPRWPPAVSPTANKPSIPGQSR